MDKLSYALGMKSAVEHLQQGIRGFNIDDFSQAFKDFEKDGEFALGVEEANKLLTDYFTGIQEEARRGLELAGRKFLEENAKLDGVISLPSGLQYKILTKGEGETPTAHSTVKVHYEGRLIDGQIFDSSYQRGEPISFNLQSVIKGWTEGLQLMNVGSTYELYIPYELAYGEHGTGPIPPCSTLIFKVELLEVK